MTDSNEFQNIVVTQEPYDPYKLPASLHLARNHFRAHEVAIAKDDSDRCGCCNFEQDRFRLGMNCEINQLRFMGAGIPLFFKFLKNCIYVLLLVFFIQGVYGLYISITGDYCRTFDQFRTDSQYKSIFQNLSDSQIATLLQNKYSNLCYFTTVTQLTLANSNIYVNNSTYDILNLATVCVLIVFLHIQRRQTRKFVSEIDATTVTPDDFSITVRNIKVETYDENQPIDYEKELDDLFENENEKIFKRGQTDGYITDIILCYDQNLFNEDSKKLNDLINEKKNLIKNDAAQQLIDEKTQEIKDQYQLILQKQKAAVEGKSRGFCGTAFIIFEKSADKDDFIKEHETSFFQQLMVLMFKKQYSHLIKYRDQQLFVTDGIMPDDVIWENQHVNVLEQTLRQSFSIFLQFGLLVADFVLILQLTSPDSNISQNIPLSVQPYISIIIGISIQIINILIQTFLLYLGDFEKHHQQDGLNSSTARKLAWLQFINTAIVSYSISIFIQQVNLTNINGGMIQTQSAVFITNSVLLVIIDILFIPQIVAKILRNYENGKKVSTLTQKELNEIQLNPQFKVVLIYATILKTMFFTAFFTTYIPWGSLISAIGFIIYYWVCKVKSINKKFNLIRRCSTYQDIDYGLNDEMNDQLEFFIPLLTIGNFIINYRLKNQQSFDTIQLISMILSVVNVFLPSQDLNSFLFPLPDNDENVSYSESKDKFDVNYDQSNPMTSGFSNHQSQQRHSVLKQSVLVRVGKPDRMQSQDFDNVELIQRKGK